MELQKFFQERGYQVKSATVVNDPLKKTGQHSYGYVSFADQAEMERCLREMNNADIKGNAIILNKQGDNYRNPQANVIIKNIPKHIQQNEVYQFFTNFGIIKSCKLQTFPDKTSKGFAFVQFDKPEEAQNAIKSLNRKE